MRVAIIGAGISGLIAASAFLRESEKYETIQLFDPRPPGSGPLASHKAVMRLRDDRIKNYLSCSLRAIDVWKCVYHKDTLYGEPNILLNNLYSLKAYGEIGDRSLKNLGRVKRFLISNIDFNWDMICTGKVEGISGRVLKYRDGKGDPQLFAYDICVSTIPMPALVSMLKSTAGKEVKFDFEPITILRCELKIRASVNQTIYFTDPAEFVPYRATIQEGTLIAEYAGEKAADYLYIGDIDCWIQKAFGISPDSLGEHRIYENKYGKIIPIDDISRRELMMELTDRHNIYSFGRFAIWRPLRIDQTLDDIEKIMRFIKVKHRSLYYTDKEV